jgi:hypothetical protein
VHLSNTFLVPYRTALLPNFRELRKAENQLRRTYLLGTSVNRTKMASTHSSDLRTHTAVIIQHWVQ